MFRPVTTSVILIVGYRGRIVAILRRRCAVGFRPGFNIKE